VCGLFGWQLAPDAAKYGSIEILAAILAMRNESRGDESWGIASRDATTPWSIEKNVGSIVRTCDIRRVINYHVIGHTRKATTGAITPRNAHPFVYKNIIGAHNGYIRNHKELNAKYQRECEVDSEHIFMHIADNLPLDELRGVGTVTYTKVDEPDAIYLGRARMSDLEVAQLGTDVPYGIVWSSSPFSLYDALHMSGFTDCVRIDTREKRLYRVYNHTCVEVGDFDFGSPVIVQQQFNIDEYLKRPIHYIPSYQPEYTFSNECKCTIVLPERKEVVGKVDKKLLKRLKKKVLASIHRSMVRVRRLLRYCGSVYRALHTGI
jgi:hypothetical protein